MEPHLINDFQQGIAQPLVVSLYFHSMIDSIYYKDNPSSMGSVFLVSDLFQMISNETVYFAILYYYMSPLAWLSWTFCCLPSKYYLNEGFLSAFVTIETSFAKYCIYYIWSHYSLFQMLKKFLFVEGLFAEENQLDHHCSSS